MASRCAGRFSGAANAIVRLQNHHFAVLLREGRRLVVEEIENLLRRPAQLDALMSCRARRIGACVVKPTLLTPARSSKSSRGSTLTSADAATSS